EGCARRPAHTGEGFDQNAAYLRHLLAHKTDRAQRGSAVFFWRRWSPRKLAGANIHDVLIGPGDPPLLGASQATMLLDPTGRLIGLAAVPPDTMPASPGGAPDWRVLFEAAGIDPATFTAAPPWRPPPPGSPRPPP